MASLVLGIAGAAALGPAGLAWGGALGMSGAQIGFIAGSSLGSMLFAPNMPDIQGPRMGDLKVQASTYGTMIPIYYGTARGAGQVIWSSDLIETSHEEEAGGKGGPSQSVTTYTYSVNCAVGVCEGEITGIRRIWANGDLIYDQSTGNLGPTGQSSNIRVYTGSETQVADSLLESYLGAGNVPAHRGLAYVVFENLQLEKYGNRIPNFSFEVVASGAFSLPAPVKQSESTIVHSIAHPFIDGVYLSTSIDNTNANPYVLHVTDVIAGTDRTQDVGTAAASNGSGYITYVKAGIDPVTGLPMLINEIWVQVNDAPTVAVAFDATTLEFTRLIQPSAAINVSSVGKMIFDESANKVIFASTAFGGGLGYNALNPVPLTWDGYDTADVTNNVFDGVSIAGENSVALSNFNTFICFFVGGAFVKTVTVATSAPHIAYDSIRNRYAIYDGNVLTKSIFKTFADDGIFATTSHSPTTTASIATFGSLDYLRNIDKYVFSDRKYIYFLNADTFETESSIEIFSVSAGVILNSFQIAAMPEYLVSYVTDPSDGLALVPITNRLSNNTVTLSSIVSDICSRVELAAGDIDVTQLTDDVEGYTIAQQMSARAALDGVQAAFFFDAVESN